MDDILYAENQARKIMLHTKSKKEPYCFYEKMEVLEQKLGGAEGIGLCRTEHMFFGEGRGDAFREIICSETAEEREKALEKVLPYQQHDFKGFSEALDGNPVSIRCLDPPLHQFVPTDEADIKKLADAQGKTVEQIKTIIASLHEFNYLFFGYAEF